MVAAETPIADQAATGSGRAVSGVGLLTAVLATATAVLVATLPHSMTGAAYAAPWWVAVIIAIAFCVAEWHVFHIEYGREAITFSLSEVPTVFALAFLGPIPAIGVRVVASMVVLVIPPRPSANKLVFNAALFSFEAALAFAIVRRIADVRQFHEGPFLVAAAIGVTVATLVGSLVVSVAIACYEGDLIARFRTEIRTSVITGPVSAAVAVVSFAPAMFGLRYAVFSVVPAVAVWGVLLQHGRLRQRYRDLESLYGFTSIVGRSLHVGDVAPAALGEVARLLRASGGLLQIYDEEGTVEHTATTGDDDAFGPRVHDDARWLPVHEARTAVGVRIEPDATVRIDARDHYDRIATSIRDDHGELGLLAIGSRHGATDQFTRHDLARLNTLAEQLAASIRKTRMHAAMEHIAMHDALTGHPNRTAFEDLVNGVLGQPRTHHCAAVFMLDLDQFKEVNDTLGHHVGDQVLIEFARRVGNLLGHDDVLARFGGDEFAAYIQRPSPAEIRELADRILSETYAPLQLDGLNIVVPVSIGIAPITDDDHDSASVLRRADIAMYAAKSQHAGCETYREDIDRRTPERLALLGDLRDALERGQIGVHYQPKVDLATLEVTGVEALARWHHPIRGWVPPDVFIPVAEETGLIKQLTDHVLTTAIRAARGWYDDGYDLGVAVNLSTLDLLDELLADRVAHRLKQHDLRPHQLTLEITESSLMSDTPRTMATIDRLHQLGIGLSLDDFGTGYSSLSYLRRLPVNELKIDRSFVANMLLEPQDEIIVRSTIDLGHNLGLSVVAEGIENQPVQDRLHSLGCDTGQGYGIARPLPPELLGTWLATTHHNIRRTQPIRSELSAQLRPPLHREHLVPPPHRPTRG